MISAKKLRQGYLDFFQQKGHALLPSASLVPENDPSSLFTIAGMQPLVPYLMGEPHPRGRRLADVQKCFRTIDIEEVGDNTHLTFFEMLGNWSLGDYFKKEAIEWSFEFLTSPAWLSIPSSMLAVSVFAGEGGIPKDEESAEHWRRLGMPAERIAVLGKEANWWPPDAVSGPCGPSTEMFYWTGEGDAPAVFDPSDSRWVEIWNDVFMEFYKRPDGTLEPLKQKNVDTGMGFERTLAVLQGKSSVFETDLFQPLLQVILGPTPPVERLGDNAQRSARILADHLRASTFLISDGVVPSNVDRGYVLRRIIRRAIREARELGLGNGVLSRGAGIIIEQYQESYPELKQRSTKILSVLTDEEKKFNLLLEKGMKKIKQLLDHPLSGKEAFDLFATDGFPLELTEEIAKEKGFAVDRKGFEEEYRKHQDQSREASKGKFKGGLVDHSEMSTKFHTATHLLHQALRRVLGPHVEQRGSNITPDRLRFDFTHPEKLSPEQLQSIEDLVNDQIHAKLPVDFEVMGVDEAKQKGAIGLFEEKYGDKIKVYRIGDFSIEICGGPHVENTGDLGTFKIVKESSSSAGIRRIKAVLK